MQSFCIGGSLTCAPMLRDQSGDRDGENHTGPSESVRPNHQHRGGRTQQCGGLQKSCRSTIVRAHQSGLNGFASKAMKISRKRSHVAKRAFTQLMPEPVPSLIMRNTSSSSFSAGLGRSGSSRLDRPLEQLLHDACPANAVATAPTDGATATAVLNRWACPAVVAPSQAR